MTISRYRSGWGKNCSVGQSRQAAIAEILLFRDRLESLGNFVRYFHDFFDIDVGEYRAGFITLHVHRDAGRGFVIQSFQHCPGFYRCGRFVNLRQIFVFLGICGFFRIQFRLEPLFDCSQLIDLVLDFFFQSGTFLFLQLEGRFLGIQFHLLLFQDCVEFPFLLQFHVKTPFSCNRHHILWIGAGNGRSDKFNLF